MQYWFIWWCPICPLSYPHSFSFFLFSFLIGWILLLCPRVHQSFHLLDLVCCLNPSIKFLSSVIIFFSSMISIWYFLLFPVSVLKFSFSSSIGLIILVNKFTNIILNSLSVKSLISFSLGSLPGVVFWCLFVCFLSMFETYFFLSLVSVILCAGFYASEKTATSPILMEWYLIQAAPYCSAWP